MNSELARWWRLAVNTYSAGICGVIVQLLRELQADVNRCWLSKEGANAVRKGVCELDAPVPS